MTETHPITRESVETLKQILREREIEESARRLETSFVDFIREAWPVLKPEEPYQHNWHIDEICRRLEAVSKGEITRLQIWIPPGMMKSGCVSIFWHPWEWTTRPWIRYWGASYETRLAGRLSAMSRIVVESDWYQERWGDRFKLIREAEYYWGNDRGGTRLATAPESTGSGEHGHRILIDDPINAKAADATSQVTLDTVRDWYDGTVVSRGIGANHARIIIMQRLHTRDLAAHVLNLEDWDVLCLPEKYEANHPYAWRGDPRKEGQYLWPSYRPPEASDAMARSLRHRAAGQLQQRPAAREGQILKRNWWRFYEPDLMQDPKRRPKFQFIVLSVDTPRKDREHNDLCAIQAWGVKGADRFWIEGTKGHMNYLQAKRAIKEMRSYVQKLFPKTRIHVLIENAGFGEELIPDLKREITGVEKISQTGEGDKEIRADRAAEPLESGNCWLPGYREGAAELSLPDDARNPAVITEFINSCALFPNGDHDDDVDAFSTAQNWITNKPSGKARTGSYYKRRAAGAAA